MPLQWSPAARYCAWLLLLALLGLACYGNVADHTFVWDDRDYIIRNPSIHEFTLHTLYWAATTGYLGIWHPLAWLSLAFDYQLFGLNPTGYKYVNLALHVLVAFVLGLTALRIYRLRSPELNHPPARVLAITAVLLSVLFCIHPHHVESVTWISERKDLLCGLFYFLCVYCYLGQPRHHPPGAQLPLSALLFATLALLSKPMAVTLPAILLLLDVYPLQRVRRTHIFSDLFVLLRTKWALISISACVALITYFLQIKVPTALEPMDQRAFNALRALGFYISQFALPSTFFALHPTSAYPATVLGLAPLYLISGLLAVLIPVGLYFWRGWIAPLAALGFILATLLPVIGIIRVGGQAFADRYAYIPMAAAYLLLGTVIIGWFTRQSGGRAGRLLATVLAGVIAVYCVQLTRAVVDTWKNPAMLWSMVLARYPHHNISPYINISAYHADEGRYDFAVAYAREAVRLKPDSVSAWEGLIRGQTLAGKRELADLSIRGMLAHNAQNPDAYFACAVHAREIAAFELEFMCLQDFTAMNPAPLRGWLRLAQAYLQRGDIAGAVSMYEQMHPALPAKPEVGKLLQNALGRGAMERPP